MKRNFDVEIEGVILQNTEHPEFLLSSNTIVAFLWVYYNSAHRMNVEIPADLFISGHKMQN